MTKGSVELHRQIPVLILEVEVPSQINLRNSLTSNTAVTAITSIDSTITIDVFQDVLSILSDTNAMRQVEHANRLTFDEVGYASVLSQTSGIHVSHRDVLAGSQCLSFVCTAQRLQLVLLE